MVLFLFLPGRHLQVLGVRARVRVGVRVRVRVRVRVWG